MFVIGNAVANKGIKSKSSHASTTDIRSSTPAAVPEASSLIGSLSQGDLTVGANEEQSQAFTNAITTESDNTNTQDDITTEDATENDGLYPLGIHTANFIYSYLTFSCYTFYRIRFEYTCR